MTTRELYQQVILDHNRAPKNFKTLENATHRAVGHNPMCGDKLVVYLEVEDGVVKDVGFQGAGCAISNASASMMTAAVKGQKVEDVRELFNEFHDMVAGSTEGNPDRKKLGRLAVLAGVREYPARVKCASLSWHTMQAALDSKDETVVTED